MTGNIILVIAAVLPILGGLWRTGKKITNSISTFIDATAENTKAISELTARVVALEKTTRTHSLT